MLPPALVDRGLTAQLGLDAALEEAERVHVLELGLRAELRTRPGGAATRWRRSAAIPSPCRSRRRRSPGSSPSAASRKRARRLGRAQVGLGDDLEQRRAAAVEVDDGAGRARDPSPSRRPRGSSWRRPPRGARARSARPRCRRGRRHGQRAADAQRLVVLRDLVRLGRVGIEVVLAVEESMRSAISRAERETDHDRLLDGGAVRRPAARPGCAVQTGQMRVFGSPPDSFAQRQNILLRVFSCTWISRPITASQPVRDAAHAAAPSSRRRAPGRTRTRARARAPAASSVFSEKAGPTSWRPTGRPSLRPARDREAGQAREVHGQREEVARVHRERIVDERPDLERDGRRGRADEHVARLEDAREVARDQRAHALRLAVVARRSSRPRARTRRSGSGA